MSGDRPARIRAAVAADATAIAALARLTFAEAFGDSFAPADLAAHLRGRLSDEDFRRALAADRFLVAEENGRPVGFVQSGEARPPLPAEPGDREIRRLYVLAERRGQGIGGRLLAAALALPDVAAAASVFLDVWEKNARARAFYERNGFVVIGAHALATASGIAADDDLIMVRRRTDLR